MVVIAVKLDDHFLVAPEKVGGVVADLGVDLGCADVGSAERRQQVWPLATGVAADRGHVDETSEGRTKAPRGRGRVVAQERGVAAREDRGQFGSERWQSGERHQ